MHGYLRRKVTYNIGRGGKSTPTARKNIPHKGGRWRGGIFGLFTDHDSLNHDIEHLVIVDEVGQWNADREYVDKGLSEGWLFYDGYYRDHHNEIFHRYRYSE